MIEDKILFYLVISAVCSIVSCAPRSSSKTNYDQKQTGDYNIRVNLKDFQIIAVVDDSFSDIGNYDYNYDYSELTVKPGSVSTTTQSSQPSSSTTEAFLPSSPPQNSSVKPILAGTEPSSTATQTSKTTTQVSSITTERSKPTSQSVSTTSQSVSTISQPVSTTSQPVSTTSQPVSTTSHSVSTTPELPSTTSQPPTTQPASTITSKPDISSIITHSSHQLLGESDKVTTEDSQASTTASVSNAPVKVVMQMYDRIPVFVQSSPSKQVEKTKDESLNRDKVDNKNDGNDKKVGTHATSVSIMTEENSDNTGEGVKSSPLGEIMYYRKCASGYARDKRGRCRKIRRPTFPLGLARLATNLATKLRPTSDESTSSLTSESIEE